MAGTKKDQTKPTEKQPAVPETTYPADMEEQRSIPAGGDGKPGPRNPEPLDE